MEPTRLTFDPATVEYVAVAVQRNRNEPFNTHLGVVYRLTDGLHHLHLCWNRNLQHQPPSPYLVLAHPGIPRQRARLYPRLCRRIWERNGQRNLTYALRHPSNARFAVSGELLDAGAGLNCASFVNVLFSSYGFQIVDPLHWPIRPEDTTWQQYLLDLLTQTDPDQAAIVADQVGSQRPRPEEVAGACLCSPYPVPFLPAEHASRYVLQFLALRLGDSYCI